ncbi:MAG TPA: CBS domain-containing protein [Casimicrobiaceae bacterium]|nr:CBS domain-containing protein [Casimicrobiaceae bacterium]
MFDESVRYVMEPRKFLTAAPETFVREAAKLMAARNVGAILIVEDDRLAGIFTERDMLVRVVARGLDALATRLADVMTRAPWTIDPDATLGYALLLMHKKGFRHLPVVQEGKPIGIVSSRSAMDPDLEEFVSEANRRKRIAAKR